MPTSIHPKAAAAGATAAVATVITAILEAVGVHLDQSAVIAVATLLVLAAGYLAPRLPGEQP